MKVHCLGMTYVKCTQFLNPTSLSVDRNGVAGDRQFLLLDEHDRPVAGHHHGLFVTLRFEFDPADDVLSLYLPDGNSIKARLDLSTDVKQADFLGLRTVALRQVRGPWEGLLTNFSGRPTRLFHCESEGAGIDILPLTLLTTGALRELEIRLGAEIDPRRFRANIIVENDLDRAEEDDWDGKLLQIGDAVVLVRGSVPRCIVTQFNPDDGRDDKPVVKALGAYRPSASLPDNLVPSYKSPGFASYAEVIKPGIISTGDRVELIKA